MRISESANLTSATRRLRPSIALKYMVDGMHSKNIFGAEPISMDDTKQFNFLEPTLKNRLGSFDTSHPWGYIMDQTVRKKITEATKRPFGTAISHLAKYKNNGKKLRNKNVKVPYEMMFESPIKDNWNSLFMDESFCLSNPDDDLCDVTQWYKHLQNAVNVDDTIYEIYGLTEPVHSTDTEAEAAAKKIKLGDVVMRSDLIMS